MTTIKKIKWCLYACLALGIFGILSNITAGWMQIVESVNTFWGYLIAYILLRSLEEERARNEKHIG